MHVIGSRWMMVLGVSLLGGGVSGCRPSADATTAKAPAATAEPGPTDSRVTQAPEAIIAASDLPNTIETPVPKDPMQVTVHRLSNGMTVYISTDRQKPRFTGWIGVRAGSRLDPAHSTGLAHYLEHMLFKGTDDCGTLDAAKEAPHVERVRQLYAELRQAEGEAERGRILAAIDVENQAQAKYAIPNEIGRMYSAMGISGVNAFTSHEETVYIGDIPANRIEAWATVEAERFSDPVFRLFYPELEAVYEEKNLSLDNPHNRVWETLYASLYPRHPYGTQTTIGSVEHLKTPAFQDMIDYFHRWYVPNNMAIVLAGDIDAQTALPVLSKAFGRLQPKRVPEPESGEIVLPNARTTAEVVAEGEEALLLAWHTVPVAHRDEAALTLMDRMLDDDRVGLLNVELELTQKVSEAGSWHDSMKEGGYFAIRVRARSDQTPEMLEPMVISVVEKLKRGEFTDADVQAAKLKETVNQKLQLEFPFARASKLMNSFVTHQNWQDVVDRDDRFQALTREDVIAVANKYLGPHYVALAKRNGKPEIPKLEKPKITPVKIDPSLQSDFAKNVIAMEAAQLEPHWLVEGEHYQHVDLPGGKLISAKNERNDLFSLSYVFKRGYRKAPYLCHALDLFVLSGTGQKPAEVVQKELYALGTTVSTMCDAETSSIQLSGVDSQFEASLAVLDRWISDPSFDRDSITQLYKTTASKRRDSLEEDWTLTAALDQYAKYGRNSDFLEEPTNAKLAKANPEHLKGLIAGLFDWQHTTLYFGPRSADTLAKIVTRGKKHRKTGDVWTEKFRQVRQTTIYFLHKDGAKANIRFVIPRDVLPRDQRPVAELLSEYLSGSMSALVFQEIRESRGLAYSAYSTYSMGARPEDQSGLLGFLSTQADKTPIAVETFLGLLQTTDIQTARLQTAKDSIDQEYRSTRIDPRWINRWVLRWDELGEKQDPRAWQWTEIGKTDLTGVQAFSSQFVDAPVIIAVVGDRARIDLDGLKAIGKVEEVDITALFSYGREVLAESLRQPKE